MNEPNRDLEARMVRLERSNRLLVMLCLAMASAPLIIAAGGQAKAPPRIQLPPGQIAPQAPLPESAKKFMSKQIQDMLAAERQVHNVLRARVFALVDQTGKTKAYLSTDERGDPMLTMFGVRDGGRSTAVSMSLGLAANQPECVFYGYDDKPRAALYASGEGRDRLPQLLLSPGGQITMKHANGSPLTRFMSHGDTAQWEVNDKDGKNALRFSSGGPATSKVSQFELTASQSGNTANIFAGPSFVSIAVNSKGTKYNARMTAEGTQALMRARGQNGPMDQVFSSKWRSPLHDVNSWQIDPKENF